MIQPKKKIVIPTHNRKTRYTTTKVVQHTRMIPTRRKRMLNIAYLNIINDTIYKTSFRITTMEIANRFRFHPKTAEKYLNHLAKIGKIRKETINGRIYWSRF